MSVPLYQAEAEFFADLMRVARRILTETPAGRARCRRSRGKPR
ncbi:hypothetical protein ACFQ2Y_10185 [Streptomyces malaysiensis subsp. malaysiensis]